MALRIANNITAMNTQRWLGISDNAMKKSLERLSSGYRINKAADDAAGLAISQSFRANIASFKVASRNTSEAAALLQVAEGGMDQIGNMLTRLKELATQASSANVGETERTKINSEATALTDEIDRIANSTKYGSTALLTGTFGASQIGTLGGGTAAINDGIVNDNVAYKFALTGGGANAGTVTVLGSDVTEGTWTLAIQSAGGQLAIANADASVIVATTDSWSTDTTITFASLGITMTFTGALTAGSVKTLTAASSWSEAGSSTLAFERTGLTSLNVVGADTGTYTITQTAAGFVRVANATGTESQLLEFQSDSEALDFDVLGISFKLGDGFTNTTTELDGMQLTVEDDPDAAGNVFQVGSENNADNQISITIGGARVTDMSLNDLDLSTTDGAQTALDTLDAAISTLSGVRGDIGASMNRLSYASANLATTIENVQAAESVIRDVDMASEMTDFTKNQILLQAGTAMLAQANMAPQQVLSLFG